MDYSKFDVEDFATDEYFIQWVKAPDESSNTFWTAWLSKNPHQKELIKKARHIVLSLEIKEKAMDDNAFIAGWANISKHIHKTHGVVPMPEPLSKPHTRRWFYAAASVSVLLMLSAAVFYHINRSVVITTAYGESRTLFLPDQSKITLNGNSSIHYKPFYFTSQSREVWLDGEAFFAVVHEHNNAKFLVHTDELAVEVLGTKFNVNSRRGKTRVVLEEGKVQLSTSHDVVVMKPGDLADVSESSRDIKMKSVNAGDYVSWKSNKLVFRALPLEEIALQLEDNFGYMVEFQNVEIQKKEFTGAASSDDIDGFLKNLSEVFGLSIDQHGKTIYIKERKENPGQSSRP
ncbi:FecR family protein [Chryseolinea lacunae]|uniref:FecR domain-containing protein n=1 Tax=Chryseolinea lacunae TaxID=2801331 RepID=A0ABS1KZL3_9BACT|nr:FecR domain-containing protein [Chryseolinea lacunae]MBL0744713.1 FecR domain-containing protein [Chryseolinea lacunae]